MGKKDILICGDKIELRDDDMNIQKCGIEAKIIDALGKLMFPSGYCLHMYILGRCKLKLKF